MTATPFASLIATLLSVPLMAPVAAIAQPAPASGAGAGQALRFDKDSGELSIARSPLLEPEELTVELWAKIEGPQAEHAQLVRKLTSWDKPGYLLAVNQSGYPAIQFRWWDRSLRTLPDSILSTWYYNQWHHFAATHSKAAVKLYVDGIQVAELPNHEPSPLAHDGEAPLRIGPEGFTGQIDELRLWSRALPAAEIRANLNHTINPGQDGLIAYWRFDNAKSADLSSNHLSFVGDPDLSARLVPSEAPIGSPVRARQHREDMKKIAKGRAEVDKVAAKLPLLNAAIYRFATSLAGEPFQSGDCWNFVNQAMTIAGAHGRDVYVFGEAVTIDKALPGDLIHFEKFQSPSFGSDQHSAILWRNHGKGKITVIHQNAPPNGKNVGLWDIDITGSTGAIQFYRPTDK